MRYITNRKDFILALGGKCQYVYPEGHPKAGQMCGWDGEGDILVLQVHHTNGRHNDDHNLAIKEIYEFARTGKLPEGVKVLCPNHHVIEDKKLRKYQIHV